MKKVYHLLGGALLSVMMLTSCGEDKIVNDNIGGGDEIDKELTEYRFTASIKQTDPLVRANMENGVYAWNARDVLTLWNRNLGRGYDFAIASANGGTSLSKDAEFVGKALVKNGHKLIAIFPRKEAKSFNDLATFSMPDIYVQAGTTAELGATSYMIATANVTNSQIPSLTFSPLTALLQLNLTNTSDRELKIRNIILETTDNVFPAELKIDDTGAVQSLLGMRNKLTLDMREQPLAQGATLKGYMNVFPSTYGDIRLMKSNTQLTITVSALDGEIERDIILSKGIQVKDLKEKIGLDMDVTANQFAAGKRYEMDLDVDYRFKIPEEGYLIDDDGNIQIYNVKGLLGWNKIADKHRTAHVTIEKDYIEPIDGVKVLDLNNEVWNPITAFAGVFEGNGVTVTNLKIAKNGFINANTGTIQNLKLKNVTFANNITEGAGALAATSTGSVIRNCIVENVTASVTKTVVFGGLVGRNSEGRIENCHVESGTITLALAGSTGNSNYGGLVGEHFNGTALIINSSVGSGLTIKHPSNAEGASCVGGIVGWNNSGKIKGSYSLATLNTTCSAQTGGLVGANSNGTILACYAAGTISGNVVNNTGGLLGSSEINNSDAGVISCYSTTQMTATNNAGNKFGSFIGRNTTGVHQCYTIDMTYAPIGDGSGNGVARVTIEQLKTKVRQMNLAIEAKEPEPKFNFKVNENSNTNTAQPLILQQASLVPGFGGSDFGDGGDI